MNETITVVVADDHPLFRDGVVKTLAAAPGIEVIAEAGDAAGAVELVREHLPDVVLLDVSMPGGGLTAAAEIDQACPVVRIIMLTYEQLLASRCAINLARPLTQFPPGRATE